MYIKKDLAEPMGSCNVFGTSFIKQELILTRQRAL